MAALYEHPAPPSEILSTRVPRPLALRLARYAAANERSISGELRRLIKLELQENAPVSKH